MKKADNLNELFVVVDQKDEVVDLRTRRECHKDKDLIHRAAGVIIFNGQGEVLLQKRSTNKDLYPGLYTLSCSGHLKKGESYNQAVKRELEEELGLKTKVEFIEKFLTRSPYETEMFALFKAEYSGPFRPNSSEIEKIDFFSKKKIRDLVKKGRLFLTPCAKKSLKRIEVLK